MVLINIKHSLMKLTLLTNIVCVVKACSLSNNIIAYRIMVIKGAVSQPPRKYSLVHHMCNNLWQSYLLLFFQTVRKSLSLFFFF